MSSNLSTEDQIRIQEEIQELFERYGAENTKDVFEEYLSSYKSTEKLKNQQVEEASQKEAAEITERRVYKPKPEEPKVQLPLNVKTIDDYIFGLNEVAQSGKVDPGYAANIKTFVEGAQAILKNNFKDKNFIMGLTGKLFGDRTINNPYEDWIDYNTERIRRLLKKHLRSKGYQFLDSDAEVGKTFDPEVHNCTLKEIVVNPAMDNRVLRVLSEGLVIDRVLHINCNVVVGQYKDPSKNQL